MGNVWEWLSPIIAIEKLSDGINYVLITNKFITSYVFASISFLGVFTDWISVFVLVAFK